METLRGFTLIELMVVIAIIGILAAVTIPAITGGGFEYKDFTTKQDCKR